MKIDLCSLVKDDTEVKVLNEMLDTIQPYVDNVYITVTADYSPKIDKLAKKRGFNLSRFKWINDFSAARNFNFSQSKGADYILWCDSDDLWLNGHLIRDYAQKAKKSEMDVVFFTYWYGCTFNGYPTTKNIVSVDIQHPRERLIRPNSNVWEGRLHETPIPLENHKIKYTQVPYSQENPIVVVHTATDETALPKMDRNRELLELQLQEERHDGEADPRTLLYLIKIYVESDDKETLLKVIEYGKEYVEKSGWDEERGVAWGLMGNAYAKLDQINKTVDCYHEAIREWPHNPSSYLRLSQAYLNLGQARQAKHWLDLGMKLPIDEKSGNMINFKELKVLSAEIMVNLAYNHEKNVDKSVEAAKLLYQEVPTDNNKENLLFLMDLQDMNKACKNIDELCGYLQDIGEDKRITNVLDVLPDSITTQPFAIKLRQKNSKPRVWGKDEICYFANFGDKHFEQWDSSSLNSGIGGSETAVIRLSEEWAKKGYKVTVYGDPITKGMQNGVNYLPWYYFNPDDEFNIFIQWRSWQLAGQIKARKFFVDLHDLFNGDSIDPKYLKHIDKLFVKSKFHRTNGKNIPDDKFVIVSNGL